MKQIRSRIKHATSLTKFNKLSPDSFTKNNNLRFQESQLQIDFPSPINISPKRTKNISYRKRRIEQQYNPEKSQNILYVPRKTANFHKNYYNKSIECFGKEKLPQSIEKKQKSKLHHNKSYDKKQLLNLFKKKNFNQTVLSKRKLQTKISLTLKETSQTFEAQQIIMQRKKIPSFIQQKIKSGNGMCITDFQMIKSLGKGKFCQVQLVKHKITNFIMAMKVFDYQKIVKMNFLQQFIRELKIQCFLNHPNVIKIYGFFYDCQKFYVLMELGSHGQLFNYVKQTKMSISEEGTSFIIKQLLKACSYLHSMNIIHRDIKPQNVVLTHGMVKLCDFGWAVYNGKQQVRSTYCGTPLYFSPQLMRGQKYDEKIDVWAIGILTYELMFNQAPFHIKSRHDLYKIISDNYVIPPNTDHNFIQFIEAMLNKDPNKRISCKKLLQYCFIKQYEGLETCQQLLF